MVRGVMVVQATNVSAPAYALTSGDWLQVRWGKLVLNPHGFRGILKLMGRSVL